MESALILLNNSQTNRHHYIFQFVFEENLGIPFECTSSISQFEEANNSIKINYSNHPCNTSCALSVFNAEFLQQIGFNQSLPTIQGSGTETIIFPSPEDSIFDFSFDVFSAIFFLLTRYEEYQDTPKDQHGRFQAKYSVATKHQFLQFPLVDIWLDAIQQKLDLPNGPKRKFKFIPTFDLDQVWSYKHKGISRLAVKLVRSLIRLERRNIVDIINILTGKKQDPYFVFNYLFQLHNQHEHIHPIYFLAVGKWSNFDKNTPIKKQSFKQFIQDLSSRYKVGLHPSYDSNTKTHQLQKEYNDLQNLIRYPLKRSRQHFLKVSFPETYSNLIQIGIEKEFSMGYAEATGFRASTARHFLWYNLTLEQTEQLRIYPFQIMDVTLFNYLNRSSQQALNDFEHIKKQIETYGGNLITIWHNSSFDEKEGWDKSKQTFFETLYSEAAQSQIFS